MSRRNDPFWPLNHGMHMNPCSCAIDIIKLWTFLRIHIPGQNVTNYSCKKYEETWEKQIAPWLFENCKSSACGWWKQSVEPHCNLCCNHWCCGGVRTNKLVAKTYTTECMAELDSRLTVQSQLEQPATHGNPSMLFQAVEGGLKLKTTNVFKIHVLNIRHGKIKQ